MRIGIITYHFAENYGSALQSYALTSYLNSLEGVEAFLLNYVTDRQERNNSLYGHREGLAKVALAAAYLPFHFWRSRKRKRFQEFAAGEFVQSRRMTDLEQLRRFVNGIDDPAEACDCLVSGSDQVWNPTITDFDGAFFFPFKARGRKVGYAISLGPATEKDVRRFLDEAVDFDSVSCREQGAADVLAGLGIRAEQIVCDPVFLVETGRWRKLAAESAVDYGSCKPYVACYFLNRPNMETYFKWAHAVADEMGLELRIINASYSKRTFQKGTILDAGPLEFLNLLMNARFVCTDSFHGTALSVIFEKQFLSFDKAADSTDARKVDLLSALGLSDRLKRVGQYDGELPESIQEKQFERARELKRLYVQSSVDYIAKEITCKEDEY